MTETRFFLCAIPATLWNRNAPSDEANIGELAVAAMNCERRIPKGVNLKNEIKQYIVLCERLEQQVLGSGQVRILNDLKEFGSALGAGSIPAIVLGSDYLSLFLNEENPLGIERFGASFFPPDAIGVHLDFFRDFMRVKGLQEDTTAQQRLKFLEVVLQSKCGMIELQTGFHVPSSDAPLEMASQRKGKASNRDLIRPVELPQLSRDSRALQLFKSEKDKRAMARDLRKTIRSALLAGEPVTIGNQARNDVITEVMNEFVFQGSRQSSQPIEVRVVYADGSEATGFPLYCLQSRATQALSQESTVPIRISLMSMRHLAMDSEVDICWFRNRDVSRTRTMAESDAFCFEVTKAQLNDAFSSSELLIHLFHTGFEPAVVGFYRGLVHFLIERERQIETPLLTVIPHYYRGGFKYVAGTAWC